MSTQAARSILFTHATPQQGFRLLELPPELADLISSNEAPTLELKSPPAYQSTSSSSSAEDAQDSVNLCTPTRTYQIRQVQSSNSLHVLRPSNDPDALRRDDMNVVAGGDGGEGTDMDADADMDMDMDPVTGGMAAISKCGSTLELHTPKEGFSAVPFLVKVVGVYHGSGGGEDGGVNTNTNTNMDLDTDMGVPEAGVRNVLFADIPVSRAQCEEAWVDLCAFVQRRCPDTDLKSAAGYCRRPSAKCKVGVWKRVVEGAVLQGIDLEKQFLVKDLWRSVLDDNGEEPFPRALFEAVVRRVCEVDAAAGASLYGAELNWTSIDKSRCMQWVGSTYLEAMAPSAESALGRSEFLNAWKDNLPEAWAKEVALSKLPEGSYNNPDPTTICFNKDGQQNAKTSATGAAAATAKKTRNWHELFKNQRRR